MLFFPQKKQDYHSLQQQYRVNIVAIWNKRPFYMPHQLDSYCFKWFGFASSYSGTELWAPLNVNKMTRLKTNQEHQASVYQHNPSNNPWWHWWRLWKEGEGLKGQLTPSWGFGDLPSVLPQSNPPLPLYTPHCHIPPLCRLLGGLGRGCGFRKGGLAVTESWPLSAGGRILHDILSATTTIFSAWLHRERASKKRLTVVMVISFHFVSQGLNIFKKMTFKRHSAQMLMIGKCLYKTWMKVITCLKTDLVTFFKMFGLKKIFRKWCGLVRLLTKTHTQTHITIGHQRYKLLFTTLYIQNIKRRELSRNILLILLLLYRLTVKRNNLTIWGTQPQFAHWRWSNKTWKQTNIP